MRKNLFYILLFLVAVFGLGLRLIDYDRLPPFGETKDEFMYPFMGLSLIKTGIPTSWSLFSSYPQGQNVTYWGQTYRLVTPFNEKPPLYSLIVGFWSMINGSTQFDQVRLSIIRIIPIVLSFFTIILVGLFAKVLFGKKVALTAALLYAIIPTIVLANRLSLTENLLVPLILLTLYLFSKSQQPEHIQNLTLNPHKSLFINHYSLIIGILCALTLLTKQIGVVLPIALIFLLLPQKKWKSIVIIAVFSAIGGLVSPLMGYLSNWQLYQNVIAEFAKSHVIGLPETIYTLFRIPGIGHKEAIFLDGSMLLGYILLLSSPFWIFNSVNKPNHSELRTMNYELLLVFPFFYILLLCLLEGGTTWYGWHLFPLFPFVTIILAKALFEIYEKLDIYKNILFYVILAASSLRFIMLITHNQSWNWSYILGIFFVIFAGIYQIPSSQAKKILMLCLFTIYVVINIYTVINLKLIYPVLTQPLY